MGIMLCLGAIGAGEKWGSLIQEPAGMWGSILPSISFLLNRSFILSRMAKKENYRSGHCFTPASEKLPPEPGEGIAGERKGSNKIRALRGFDVL